MVQKKFERPNYDLNLQLWHNPYIRAPVYLLGIYLVYLFLKDTRVIWISFLIAYTLAYLAHPLITKLERRGFPRWLGVLWAMLALLLLLGGLVFIGSRVVREVAELAENIPAFVASLQTLPQRLGRLLPGELSDALVSNIGNLESALETFRETALSGFGSNSSTLLRRAAGMVGGVFQVGIILILTAYLLYTFAPTSKAF